MRLAQVPLRPMSNIPLAKGKAAVILLYLELMSPWSGKLFWIPQTSMQQVTKLLQNRAKQSEKVLFEKSPYRSRSNNYRQQKSDCSPCWVSWRGTALTIPQRFRYYISRYKHKAMLSLYRVYEIWFKNLFWISIFMDQGNSFNPPLRASGFILRVTVRWNGLDNVRTYGIVCSYPATLKFTIGSCIPWKFTIGNCIPLNVWYFWLKSYTYHGYSSAPATPIKFFLSLSKSYKIRRGKEEYPWSNITHCWLSSFFFCLRCLQYGSISFLLY